jgi:hypothetical protein
MAIGNAEQDYRRDRLHKALTGILADFGEGAKLGVPDRLLADICMDALDSNRHLLKELSKIRRAAGRERHTSEFPRTQGGF